MADYSDYGLFLPNFEDVYQERQGDVRFPSDLAKLDAQTLFNLGLEIPALGQAKLVSCQEFKTFRRQEIALNRRYFNNEPPGKQLDYIDPLTEMPRVYLGIAREAILKGARFLIGKGRFEGSKSFVFPNAPKKFKAQFDRTWTENKITSMLKRTARTNLWSGNDFWKARIEKVVEQSAQIDEENTIVYTDKVREVNVHFTHCDPEHFHAIMDPNDYSRVLAWVYQYEKLDGTFYREEIFRDVTYVYTGILKKNVEKEDPSSVPKINIPGSGFVKAEVSMKTDSIIFTLIGVNEYPDFGMFPLVIFSNNPETYAYGCSELKGLHGKFDTINMLVTDSVFSLQQQASPLLWTKGTKVNPNNNVHSADSVWQFPEETAELKVLSWEGTPEAVFKMIDLLSTQVYRTIGVPKSSELGAFTNVSGDALNIINTDIVDATNDRRLDLEFGFHQMVEIIRKSMGLADEIEDDMLVLWGPVFPESVQDKNSRLVTLAREGIIRKRRVVELDETIPNHMKQELMQEAETMQTKDESLKEQAITAQIKGGGSGGGQGKRVAQRAAGLTKERGPAKE